MHIRLSKVIIGTDITGMILAPVLGAVFIPVSFVPSWGWEFCDLEHFWIENARKCFFVPGKFDSPDNIKELYSIRLKDEIINPKLFYWEIERFYYCFLSLNSLMYDNFDLKKVELIKNQLFFRSPSRAELTVTFDQCWIINPGDHFLINQEMQPVSSVAANHAHLAYYLKINTDSNDAKGLQHEHDFESLEHDTFTKIWWSKPFGAKKFEHGFDPRKKRRIVTTRDITFLCENVPIDLIDDEQYQIHSIRAQIYKLFAPKYKRIQERGPSFDKELQKFILQTNLDVYEDTEKIKFIYYDEKSEIVCQKNLDEHSWPASSQRILLNTMKSTMNSLLTNTLPKKILF